VVIRFVEELLETRRLEMVVAETKRIFAYQVSY